MSSVPVMFPLPMMLIVVPPSLSSEPTRSPFRKTYIATMYSLEPACCSNIAEVVDSALCESTVDSGIWSSACADTAQHAAIHVARANTQLRDLAVLHLGIVVYRRRDVKHRRSSDRLIIAQLMSVQDQARPVRSPEEDFVEDHRELGHT